MAKKKKTGQTTTPTAVHRVQNELWLFEFRQKFEQEMIAGVREFATALEGPGERSWDQAVRIAEQGGSLPLTWTTFWRPMKVGRPGSAFARQSSRLQVPVLAQAVDRLARARGSFVELVSISGDRKWIILRDLFDGTLMRVPASSDTSRPMRWRRYFGWFVDLGTGEWYLPTVFFSAPFMQKMEPGALVGTVRDHLKKLGIPETEIDSAAPHAGFTKWAGPTYAALHLRDAEDAKKEKTQSKFFLATTEGDRFEPLKVRVQFPKGVNAERMLMNAPGLVRDDAHSWTWLSTPDSTTPQAKREVMGRVTRESDGFELGVSSPQRLERMLDFLGSLLGHRPTVTDELERIQHWIENDHLADAPGEGVAKILMQAWETTQFDSGDLAGTGADGLFLSVLRQQLREPIPALGGIPTELVATAEGRAKVEEWIVGTEKLGIPGEERAYLDLDPLRVELGLETVANRLGELE